MQRSIIETSALYRALTLSERAGLAPASQQTPKPFDPERARRRLECWRAQAPFAQEGRLSARLALDGLSEADLYLRLGAPDEALGGLCSPAPSWLTELAAALSASPPGDPVPVPESARAYALAPALAVITPLIRRALEQLGRRASAIATAYPDVPFDPASIADTLYASLAPQLVHILGRVMALEINVARLRGVLSGNTPEERASSFFDQMTLPGALAGFFAEYPVLARRLIECLGTWVDTSAEFLTRLGSDWELLLSALWGGSDPGPLLHIEGGGDTHRGGHTVLIARFTSGQKLVYKPRSLAVDQHFQELLDWLNQRGQQPAFRSLALLDRDNYGWVEFVQAAGCATPAEVRRFYERQGGYLALLYTLDAADFHNENLIAAGEHPVLIDLEALFHPRLTLAGPVSSTALAGAVLDDSVLRIGLLPHRLQVGVDGRAMDISGLGGAAGQLTPFAVPYWEQRGTDKVHLARKSVAVPVASNRPSLAGAEIDLLEYTESIVHGFECTYRILLAHREALLALSGPLASFDADEIRVIVRPTARYDELLNLSHHPDLLRDALDRDRHFDRLWLGVDNCPHLEKLLRAEQADLRSGDIPLFTTRPSTRDIWTARGERLANFFTEPSARSVERRIARLSEADLAMQVRYTRGSLATLRVGRDQTPHSARLHTLPLPRLAVPPQALGLRLVAAARAIGDQLAATAIGTREQLTWVGMTLVGDRYWALAPLDTDLYTGLPGVVLFLGTLGKVTGEERYTLLCRRALATLIARVDADAERVTNIGAFSGWGGIIYVLSQLSEMLGDPALRELASHYAGRLSARIERDEGLDLMNGSAGCLLALLGLHELAPSAALLTTATLCGERLLATARPMEPGLAWQTPMPATRPLCGLSHGAAGMALALAALGGTTGEARFQAAARAALDYEASAFSPARLNWPDWRYDDTAGSGPSQPQTDYMVTWCHGAPGIGLARLAMLADLEDARSHVEIRAAVVTTLAEGFSRSHSLCHGDTGNLEFLAEASRALGDRALAEQVERGSAALLESIASEGLRCGVPTGVEAPGLMMGLSGIGYGLLRLAHPELVPSVLTVGPRHGRRRSKRAGFAA